MQKDRTKLLVYPYRVKPTRRISRIKYV